MKRFKVTYFNSSTGNQKSLIVKGLSLESVTKNEEETIVRFQKINPAISLVSVERA